MRIDLKQNLKLSQQLLMTPQLRQAIQLLQLPRLDLEQYISKELAENPVLEEIATFQNESEPKEASDSRYLPGGGGEAVNYEQYVSEKKTLSEHLLSQIGMLDFTDEEKKIATLIVGNLTERGFLEAALSEIASQENVDFEVSEGVLDTIQRLDPVGVGARDLPECLLVQLRQLGVYDALTKTLIQSHLPELTQKKHAQVAKKLKVSVEDVLECIKTINKLDPFPARSFTTRATQFVVPDVYFIKVGNDWVIHLNHDGIPELRVASGYAEDLQGALKKEDKQYISEKVKAAAWLIKGLAQRQSTIFKVSECILHRQKNFFEKGDHFLRPMILKDIANDLGFHESTISRVTSHKYIHSPRGIFEFKYFFSNSVTSSSGEELSSSSIKAKIKELVAGENKKKPYSDQKLVELLSERGVEVARRTVAKYREQLELLPSSKRKSFS